MHNLLFDNQKQLGAENLKSFAGTLGLDTTAFNECLDSKKHEKTVQGVHVANPATFDSPNWATNGDPPNDCAMPTPFMPGQYRN